MNAADKIENQLFVGHLLSDILSFVFISSSSHVIPHQHFHIKKYSSNAINYSMASPEEQGCISEFENTAAFSREYQLAQRCMCDGEHMFSCPPDSSADLGLRFPEHHKSLVAKKYKPAVSMHGFILWITGLKRSFNTIS